MIGQIVSAALWAVLASLVLSLALGAAVGGLIRFSRPAAATRQALWSVALAATGLAPVAILAVMLIRGATGAGVSATHDAVVPSAGAVATGHAERSRGIASMGPIGAAPRQTRDDRGALRVPAPPELAPLAADAIVAVWALGALAGLLGLTRSLARVRGLKLRSSALEGDLATELPWLTTLPGREIYLRLSYEIETPIAVGFRRPVILIPTAMATAAGLTSIEPLVMHEYAHLARRDDWTNAIQRAIERIFWFNPLVWMLGRRLALEREVAADEAVVARTHDAKNYATALWRLAQEMRMPEHVVVAPGAMLTRKQISVRIERLLDDAPVAGRRFGTAAFAAGTLALTSVAAVAATAPPIVLTSDTQSTPARPVAVSPINGVPAKAAYPPPRHAPAPRAATPIAVAQAAASGTTAATAATSATPASTSAPKARIVTVIVHESQTIPEPPLPQEPPALGTGSSAIPGPLSDADIEHLKALGKRLGADVARQLAEQRWVLGQRHHDDRSGPITRDLVASCTGCSFAGGSLIGLNLGGLDLTGDDFNRATLDGANFSHATLRGTSFAHASLTGAQFNDTKLTGVNFNHANLNDANFSNAFLIGVDFSHATLDGAVTTGVRLIGSALP